MMATGFAASWPGWRALLPSLVLAYPITVLLFQGGPVCGPVCFEATPAGVVNVGLGLLASLVVGAGIASVLGPEPDDEPARDSQWVATPAPAVGPILLGIFGLFVVLMALDTLTIYESIWKPVAMPSSFILFFPVWVLYMATFPLSVVFSALGLAGTPVLSLVVRGLVVGIGFPVSVILQYHVVDGIVGTDSRTR